ncbi:hypothetical protein Tco_0718290 [Tanacetum coccineum]
MSSISTKSSNPILILLSDGESEIISWLRFLQTLLEFVFKVGWMIARAESSDEVLLEITPAFRAFSRCSLKPSFSDSFQTLSVRPPEKEILRNSLRSCPLTSNVKSSGQVNLLLVLFRSRARYCSIVRVSMSTFSVSDSDDSNSWKE